MSTKAESEKQRTKTGPNMKVEPNVFKVTFECTYNINTTDEKKAEEVASDQFSDDLRHGGWPRIIIPQTRALTTEEATQLKPEEVWDDASLE